MKYILSFFLLSFVFSEASCQVSDFEKIDFSKADSLGFYYKVKGVINPEKTAEDLTRNLDSDVEKFRAIFRWVAHNIGYDTKLYHLNKKKQKEFRYDKKGRLAWSKKISKLAISRTLKNRIAICSGYSSLLETMCEHVNIKCNIINGIGKCDIDALGNTRENHSWNSVYLNGKWYLCDVTWASGYVNKKVTQFTRSFDECYFLTDPHYFIANHYASNPAMNLIFDRPSLKEFSIAPVKVTGFIKNKINNYNPENGLLKIPQDSVIRFSFTSNSANVMEAIQVRLYDRKVKNSEDEYKTKIDLHLKRDKEGGYYFYFAFKDIGDYEMEVFLLESRTGQQQQVLIYNAHIEKCRS